MDGRAQLHGEGAGLHGQGSAWGAGCSPPGSVLGPDHRGSGGSGDELVEVKRNPWALAGRSALTWPLTTPPSICPP